MYNFNEKIDRSKNHAAKWSEMKEKFGRDDLIPMWVADMDIKTAPEILEAMREKLNQEIFGYVYRPDSYFKAATNWCDKRFGYKISDKRLVHSPGVVPSMKLIVKMLTKENDKIMIQTPVYPPFSAAVKDNGRVLIENRLKREENGRYTIDFDDFENRLKNDDIKLFIMCNPHNPVGRVWKKEELEKMAKLCLKYNVRILADEIWRDLVLLGYKHIPMASLGKEIEDITITLFSPTKTFNLAGLQASFVDFPRENERKEFETIMSDMDMKRNNAFSIVAFEAAYTKGEKWLEALLKHLEENIEFVVDYIKNKIPNIKVYRPEGTYLIWLDFTESGIESAKLQEFLVNKARVAMNAGESFGESGKGFARMNIACPRYMVEESLKRLEMALKKELTIEK